MPPTEMNFTGNSRRCRFNGARQADGRRKFALAISQRLRESRAQQIVPNNTNQRMSSLYQEIHVYQNKQVTLVIV